MEGELVAHSTDSFAYLLVNVRFDGSIRLVVGDLYDTFPFLSSLKPLRPRGMLRIARHGHHAAYVEDYASAQLLHAASFLRCNSS